MAKYGGKNDPLRAHFLFARAYDSEGEVLVMRDERDHEPWAHSPHETAGPLVSQQACSRTTDTISGNVSRILAYWGWWYRCPCGQRFWVRDRLHQNCPAKCMECERAK